MGHKQQVQRKRAARHTRARATERYAVYLTERDMLKLARLAVGLLPQRKPHDTLTPSLLPSWTLPRRMWSATSRL